MDLSKLLNACDDPRPSPCERTDRFRSLPSLTSTFPSSSHQHRPSSLTSLVPLESALPRLSRSSSNCSESTFSPLTPQSTPEGYQNTAFKRDPCRHSPADLQRPGHHQQHHHHREQFAPSGSSLDPSPRMDPFAANDFMVGVGSPSFHHSQLPQLQPVPGQIPLPQTQLSPSTSLASLDQPAQPASSRSTPKVSTKKNSYPCPVSKQYNCVEHFTTSGHAARHAKKHTGKKDAICPECKKAFTRKDNMEQHRRTHSNNRGASKSSSAEDTRQRKSLKLQQQQRRKIPSAQSDDIVNAPQNPEMAQQGMSAAIISPHPSAMGSDPLQFAMLDPQLRTSDSQSMFPDITSASMASAAFWDAQQQMQMPFMQNRGASPSAEGPFRARPRIQPSSYRDEIHYQFRSAPSLHTPSSSPTSSSGEPRSPSRLDTLAFAASTQLQ